MAFRKTTFFDLFMKLRLHRLVIFFRFWMRKKSTNLKKKVTFRKSHLFRCRGTHGFRCADHARVVPSARRAKPPHALVRGAGSSALRMAARRTPGNRNGLNSEDRSETRADIRDFPLITLRFNGIRHSTGACTNSGISGPDPDHDFDPANIQRDRREGREPVAGSHVTDIRAAYTRRGRTRFRRIELGLRFACKIIERKGGGKKMIDFIKNVIIASVLLELIIYIIYIVRILILMCIVLIIMVCIVLLVLIYFIIKLFVTEVRE